MARKSQIQNKVEDLLRDGLISYVKVYSDPMAFQEDAVESEAHISMGVGARLFK